MIIPPGEAVGVGTADESLYDFQVPDTEADASGAWAAEWFLESLLCGG